MSRYTKQHYEDVARILQEVYAEMQHGWLGGKFIVASDVPPAFINRFADLFAADNPPNSRCWRCGDSQGAVDRDAIMCTRPHEGHNFGGFDRERFLEACRLEERYASSEQGYSDYVAGKIAGEFE